MVPLPIYYNTIFVENYNMPFSHGALGLILALSGAMILSCLGHQLPDHK